MSDHIVYQDVECHRCNAFSEVEMDISEEIAEAQRDVFRLVLSELGDLLIVTARGKSFHDGLGSALDTVRALAAMSEGKRGDTEDGDVDPIDAKPEQVIP